MIAELMLVAASAVAPVQHANFGGLDRTYRVYRPANLSRDRAVPLVVMLHGGFGSGAQAERAYHWDDAARRHGFVVVYPDGIARAWNAGTCCGRPARERVDDVGFLSQLITDVSKTQHIDASRVAVTGMSNGAMMAYRMACQSRVPLRAIGPVSGSMMSACVNPQQTTVVAIHGTADRNVPYDGGRGEGPAGVVTPPIPSVIARWRAIDGCAPPRSRTSGGATTLRATCPDGRTVTLITIYGAGHQWPGGEPPPQGLSRIASAFGVPGLDTPSRALDATEVLYNAMHLASP